jgi:hypothetical protein
MTLRIKTASPLAIGETGESAHELDVTAGTCSGHPGSRLTILPGRPSARPIQEHVMKFLLAAAAVATTFVGVTAASANPMGGYAHGESYESSSWDAGSHDQRRWGERDPTGYGPSHGVRYDREPDRNLGRWHEQPSNYDGGHRVGARQGYMGYGAHFVFPNQHAYRPHW